ncbi:MAG: hypothetical protein FJ387_25825 [Verrucomicrobia bacterium]|nr:hypothetical protein [Verrucomicrobiota bacterium]
MDLHTVHRTQGGWIGCQHLIQVAETGKQGFRQWLNVVARDAEGQEQFEKGRIRARRGSTVKEPLTQPLTVTGPAIIVTIHSPDTCWLKPGRRWACLAQNVRSISTQILIP